VENSVFRDDAGVSLASLKNSLLMEGISGAAELGSLRGDSGEAALDPEAEGSRK